MMITSHFESFVCKKIINDCLIYFLNCSQYKERINALGFNINCEGNLKEKSLKILLSSTDLKEDFSLIQESFEERNDNAIVSFTLEIRTNQNEALIRSKLNFSLIKITDNSTFIKILYSFNKQHVHPNKSKVIIDFIRSLLYVLKELI
jgi:hypothetical protein